MNDDGLGARIHAHRSARGWSQAQLAARLAEVAGHATVTRHDVSRWERGAREPRFWLPYLTEILGDLTGQRTTLTEAHPGDMLRRREFLGAAGVVALDLGLSDPEPRHVAPELVDYFTAQLRGHYLADMHLGPHLLVPTVETQFDLVLRLANAAERRLRRELLGVGAAYAAMAGWLHQDAGDLVASDRWRTETLNLSHRTGDAQLVGYALVNKAMLAVDIGDGTTAVDLAESVLAGERALAPKVRVLASVQGAHGYSLLGDYAATERLLDHAARLTEAVDDGYAWGNACRRTDQYVNVQRASCHGRLGRSESAVVLWSDVLRAAPTTSRRDTGVYLARQATALAGVSEREQAATVALDAMGCFHDTGSARLRGELLRLREVTASWGGSRQGRELREILAPLAN